MELDQLYKKLNKPFDFRLKFFQAHPEALDYRDDLYLEQVTLFNQLGEYAKAKELIATRKFHPWEGGEGKVSAQYQICRLGLAREALSKERFCPNRAIDGGIISLSGEPWGRETHNRPGKRPILLFGIGL